MLSFWDGDRGLGCFIGFAYSLGMASGSVCLFFKPYQLPPPPPPALVYGVRGQRL